MVKLTTYLPGVGLLGLALYQALNQHDPLSAAHTLGQALTLFGVGSLGSLMLGLHGKTVEAVRSGKPRNFQV